MDGAGPQVKRIVEIAFEEGLINSGSSKARASVADGRWTKEVALASQEDTHGFICCFNDREKMKRVLARLKEEDLGISIVVSGLIEEVIAMTKEVGLKPHTVNLSLGIRGKKELLPAPDVLEFTTMCGHSLVASRLVEKAIADVKAGTKTAHEAARTVAMPCICGIVNLARATELLEQL